MEKATVEPESRYNLELERIINEIRKSKAKLVLLQFPDGLKKDATAVVDFLEEKTKGTGTEFIIWAGTCYGACDIPAGIDRIKPKIDLVVQFGHNELLPNY